METLASNTGSSLAGICNSIDGTTATDGETYHCCVNEEENKMYCAETALAAVLQINTANGANVCDTSDNAPICASD